MFKNRITKRFIASALALTMIASAGVVVSADDALQTDGYIGIGAFVGNPPTGGNDGGSNRPPAPDDRPPCCIGDWNTIN